MEFWQTVKKLANGVGGIIDKLDKVESDIAEVKKELDAHVAADEWAEMKQRRVRILRFADDVRDGKAFSEEYWDDIVEDIDHYEEYCSTHPGYHNNKGQMAMRYIKDRYYEKLEEH